MLAGTEPSMLGTTTLAEKDGRLAAVLDSEILDGQKPWS